MGAIPYGLCHCGCGQKTNLAPQTHRGKGWVKGEPKRFILQHHERTSGVDWIEEDRGYSTRCWVWQLSTDRNGYGRTASNGRTRGAHRVYYERAHGPVPGHLVMDHLCRVAACVNPEHLEPVTQAENVRRGAGCRLTIEAARAIRTSVDLPAVLAQELGVGVRHVWAVRTGRRWREDVAT